jgi:two-component system LytT family sensor kinase
MAQQSWFIRYKLYHIPFWMVYNYLMWALYLGSFSEAAHEQYFSVFWAKCLFYTIFPAFAVYFNLYFLVPRYLQKGRYGSYIVLLVLTIAVSSLLIVPGYFLTAWLAGTTAEKMFQMTWSWNSFYHAAKASPLTNTIAAVTLGMSIKLAKNWVESQRRHQMLEKEKVETELKFLRYQLNPHFLFNSINSIFFLIHKNPDMASASLAKFSELLRHQLYESNDRLTQLDKELEYLDNFIGLEQLRQSSALKTEFNITNVDNTGLAIAPFILMTFVENAFKHVSRDKGEGNWIKMNLTVENCVLRMHIANSRSAEDAQQAIHYGGIGLKNTRRRLELLYPQRYSLEVAETADTFSVTLKLNLESLT